MDTMDNALDLGRQWIQWIMQDTANMGILDQTVTTWLSPAQEDTAELQDTNSDLAELPALVTDHDEDDDSTLTSHKSNPNEST
jgi:hypothetical protein